MSPTWTGSLSSSDVEGVTNRFDECVEDSNLVYLDWSNGAFPPERDFYFSRTKDEAIIWLKANQTLRGGMVAHQSGTPQGGSEGRLFTLEVQVQIPEYI